MICIYAVHCRTIYAREFTYLHYCIHPYTHNAHDAIRGVALMTHHRYVTGIRTDGRCEETKLPRRSIRVYAETR